MFRQYQLELIIHGRDRASRQVNEVNRSLNRLGRIVSGILIAETIRQVGGGLSYLGQTALESYESLQKLGFASEALIAKELALGQVVRNTQQVTRIDPEVQEELTESQRRLELLGVLIPEYEQKLKDLADAEGTNSSKYVRTSQALEDLRHEYDLLPQAIITLESLLHRTEEVVTETRVGMMSMADAMKIAGPQAQQLTDWMERLAIRTPFNEEDVANTLRLAAAYEFTTLYASNLATEEERLKKAQEDGVVTAQRLTKALLDFTAGTGLPEENIQQLALAFGQVEATGHLAGQEIRQFINAGLGVSTMAAAMGMTVEQFQALQARSEILAEDLIPALVDKLENNFGGAAERYMQTFPGIMQGLRTMTGVLLRDFFAPLFEIATPKLSELFDNLSSPETRASIRQYGEDFAQFVVVNVGRLDRMLQNIREINREVQAFVQPKFDLITPEQRAFIKEGAVNTLIGFFGLRAIGTVRTVLGLLGGIAARTFTLGAVGTGFRLLWEQDWNSIQGKTRTAWEQHIKPAYDSIKGYLTTDLPDGLKDTRDQFIDFTDTHGKKFVDFILIDAIPAVTNFATVIAKNLTLDLDALVKTAKGEVQPTLDRLNYYLIIGKGEAKHLADNFVLAASGLGDKLTPETKSYIKQWTSDSFFKAEKNARTFYELITTKALEGARIIREELKPETTELGSALDNLGKSGERFFDGVIVRGILGNIAKLTSRTTGAIQETLGEVLKFFDWWADDTRLAGIIGALRGELQLATIWVNLLSGFIDRLAATIETRLNAVTQQALMWMDFWGFTIHKLVEAYKAFEDGRYNDALLFLGRSYMVPESREQYYRDIGRNRLSSGVDDRFNGIGKDGTTNININARNARDAELAIWQIAQQARQQMIAIGQ